MDARDTARLAERAIREKEIQAAILLLAGLADGVPPSAEATTAVLPFTLDATVLLILSSRSEGDRVKTILDACREGYLPSVPRAMLLFVASECLGDAEPPRELLVGLRRVARASLDFVPGTLVGHAALALGNEDLEIAATDWVRQAEGPSGEAVLAGVREILGKPVLEALPKEESEPIEGGYTIQRDTPKTGRNAPCPCGSGRKYKRCCGAPGAVQKDGATPRPERVVYSPRMTFEQFGAIRPADLLRIDPQEVSDLHLVYLYRSLSAYRAWPEAGAALDELSRREGDAGALDADGHRYDLLHDLLDYGATDEARRQAERIPQELLTPLDRHALDYLLEPGESLAGLEELIREALSRPGPAPQPGAGDRHRPFRLRREGDLGRLGPLECRGGGPGPAPAAAGGSRLGSAREWRRGRRGGGRGAPGPTRPRGGPGGTRRRPGNGPGEAARNREYQRQVRALDEELREAKARESKARDLAAESLETGERVEDLLRRHRELKTLLKASNHERAQLRKKLTGVSRRLADAKEDDAAAPEADPEEAPARMPERMAPALPSFNARFEASFMSAPPDVGRIALRAVGGLSGADPAAWANAKRMKSTSDVLSVRVGRSHRLLFRTSGDAKRLEVLELVARRDLEAALRRYR